MITLRDYQESDSDALFDLIKPVAGPQPRIFYQLPTGGGKTAVTMDVAQRWLRTWGSVTFMAHKVELVEQALKRAVEYGIPAIDTYTIGSYLPNVLNVQSIGKARRNPPKGGLLIVDEAHHATSKTWAKIINEHDGPVLGCSATPWRLVKHEGFDHLFHDLHIGPPYQDLVLDGHLIAPTIYEPAESVRGNLDIGSTKDFIFHTAGEKVMQSLVDLPIDMWNSLGGPERGQALFYAATSLTAVKMANRLHSEGHTVGILLSNDEELESVADPAIITDRKEADTKFQSGELKCLLNILIVTEGYDVPAVPTIVIARPTKSLALHYQMVGRGSRPAPGKEDVFIIDAAENTSDPEIGNPLYGYNWSLLPRDEHREGPAPTRHCEFCPTTLHAAATFCFSCGEMQGRYCTRCGKFRWSYWGPGICDYCEREERNRARQVGDFKQSGIENGEYVDLNSLSQWERFPVEQIAGTNAKPIKVRKWLENKSHLVRVHDNGKASTLKVIVPYSNRMDKTSYCVEV